MSEWKVVAPLAYRGKEHCDSMTCTRMLDPETKRFAGGCYGWHCSYCDEPCGSQGHPCDASATLVAEAKRQEGKR